jgi:hypothetical protein
MSIWTWVYDYENEAYASGDSERSRLSELLWEAECVAVTDPCRALALREQGRDLAEQLGEPWWVLLFDHWRLQSLIHDLGDLKAAQRLAMEATVEARKPIFRRFPQRICLHEDLIWIYLIMDGRGYAPQIHAALEYMETQIEPGIECESCLYSIEANVALLTKDFDAIEQTALRLLALTDSMEEWQRAHNRGRVFTQLAKVAHHRKDWEKLDEWASAGLGVQGDSDKLVVIALFTIWRALALHQVGDRRTAHDLFQQATSLVQQHQLYPGGTYYYVLTEYLTESGRPELALDARRQQLSSLKGKQSWTAEYRCRVETCRLLVELGRPVEDELSAAETVGRKLRKPDPPLSELREFVMRGLSQAST